MQRRMRGPSGSHRPLLGASIGVLALVVAGCNSGATPTEAPSAGTPWSQIEADAKTEGEAIIYTTDTDLWGQSINAAAQTSIGLGLTIGVRGSGGTIAERLVAEQTANAVNADLFSTTDKNFMLTHADWFVDLSTAGLPNYDSYPDTAKWQNVCVDIKQSVSGILYNTELVPADKVPTSWEDVTDPYWKDKTIIYDPSSTDTALGWAIQMRKAFGDDFLRAIAAQNPTLSPSSIPAAEQVSSGAFQITYLSNADSSADLRNKGAPLEFVVGTNPTIGTTGCVGILKDAKHPNAARVMINFLMSATAQSAACNAGLPLGSPINAPGCLELPDGWTPTPVDETGRIEGAGDPELRSIVLGLLGINS